MNAILIIFFCYAVILILYSFSYRNTRHRDWRPLWLLTVAIIFTMSATRTGGSDWENYEYLYLYMSHADGLLDAILKNAFFEPGYVTLNYVFHTYTDDRRPLIIFEAAINSFAIWTILSRTRGGPILLVWLFPLQFANILAVRQTLATSLFIVATTLLRGKLSRILSALSALIHISSLVLLFGRFTQYAKPNLKNCVIFFTTMIAGGVFAFGFLADKLANYQINADDLSNVTGTEIVFGKGLTVFLLGSIDFFSRHQVRYKGGLTARPGAPTALYILYLIVIAASSILPPLARLSTPLELLIAWAACDSISRIREQRPRIIMTLLLVAFAALKMIKIVTQFSDIYEVCFLCS